MAQCRSISIWPSGWGSSKEPDFTKTHPSDGSGLGRDAQVQAQEASSSPTIQAVHQTSDTSAAAVTNQEILSPSQSVVVAKPLVFEPDQVEAGGLLSSIPERIGYLKEVCGLDFGWGTSTSMEWLLEHIHITAGYTWATSIIILAALTRTCAFYFTAKQSDMGARIRSAAHLTKPLQGRMKEASMARDQAEIASTRAEIKAINKAYGVKYLHLIYPMLFIIPVHMGSFRVMRNMAALPVPALETENWLWLSNLTSGDPIYALPVINSLFLYLTLKVCISTSYTFISKRNI